MKQNQENIYLLAGRSHPSLKKGIIESVRKAGHLDIREIPVEFRDFPGGEIYCRPTESIRGKKVFVLQTANRGEINRDLMELFILLNSVKLASVDKIYLIIPYLPYSRQERKDIPRAPISAAMLGEMFTKVCNVSTVITFDLHEFAIEGFYATANVPMAHLTTINLFHYYFGQKIKTGELNPEHCFFASPDFGGLKLNRRLAKCFDLGNKVTAINKIRHPDGQIENRVFGEISNKTAIIFDDIIDTGSSIISAVEALKEGGTKEFYVAGVHGIFSGEAVERLNEEKSIKEVVVTDTIAPQKFPEKFKVISTAPLLAEVLKRIIKNESLRDYEIQLS